ncbi:transmembrane protein 116 isoform X3 [Chrysemys picta bellii]|uniref:transmembrane protein 116 isoform X3 n=1 Tax=Chrysemys picta bellii TaxID=8478 RepID=UPI0032B21741
MRCSCLQAPHLQLPLAGRAVGAVLAERGSAWSHMPPALPIPRTSGVCWPPPGVVWGRGRQGACLSLAAPIADREPLEVLDHANRIGRIATILSSVIPFLLMVPVFCLGNSNDCYQNFSQNNGCLLMHTETVMLTGQLQTHGVSVCSVIYFYGVGVFLVSFLISFIAIMVLLIQARALYKRFINSTGFLGDQQWAMIKIVEQQVVFYPIAFFCCWGPAVLLGIVKLTVSVNSRICMALYILQALTAASQGLLNCIVYGWTQHMFRCMKRNACRDIDTQTPLLRSQKKSYASMFPTSTQAAAVATSTVL